ncbi:MAG: hypothetical protein H6742_19495 [Alphaproteobacteria bacterium]|nr:hypothetical protein [Alphaproteobacteria bacterium]
MLALLATLAGCGGKKPHVPDTQDLAEMLPVLPAAEAPVYATGGGPPPDPIVALAVGELPWDEALSGAAGALAVNTDVLTMSDARLAAWRAGYPYALVGVATETTGPAELPTAIRGELDALRRPGDQVGLTRARVGEQDRWVGIVGRPVAGVPSFPRQHDLGDRLAVELAGGLQWTLVSPTGQTRSGVGPVSSPLGEVGEWWLEVRGGTGMLGVPLHVGMVMPTAPVLEAPGEAAVSPADARDRVLVAIEDVRLAFDLPVPREDPTLHTLSDAPLQEVVDGVWDHARNVERLRSAGFVGGSADQVWCRGRTPVACVDALMRSATGRAALLAPGHRLVGVATRVETDGVTVVASLASE